MLRSWLGNPTLVHYMLQYLFSILLFRSQKENWGWFISFCWRQKFYYLGFMCSWCISFYMKLHDSYRNCHCLHQKHIHFFPSGSPKYSHVNYWQLSIWHLTVPLFNWLCKIFFSSQRYFWATLPTLHTSSIKIKPACKSKHTCNQFANSFCNTQSSFNITRMDITFSN